jgi:RNA polymerase sigma-70 factor (ECF subfamily)
VTAGTAQLTPAQEQRLVARAQRGSTRAFERLYRVHAPVIYSYVLVPMLGDHDDAQDCLRETFLAAHKHLATYVWRPPGLYAWLKVLAKNKARDLLRAAGRRERVRGAYAEHIDRLVPEVQSAADERVRVHKLRAEIEAVLERLNPRYAEVLRLRLLEDRDRDECAKRLEVKVATLDVLLYRACRAFRQACVQQNLALEEEL